MSDSWSSPSSSSHSASFLIPTHNVTLTDIMENGFMADTFFSVNSTPFDSTYAEGDGFLKMRTSSRSGSFYLLPNNPTRMTESGFTTDINSLSCLMVTVPDSSKQTVDDLQKSFSTLSTSDALTSTCNAPLATTAPIFDLSALVSDQNGRFRTSSRSGSLYLPSNNPTLVESGFATVSEHNSRFRTSSRGASLHIPSSNPTLMVESGFATEMNSLNCLMLTVPDSNKLTVDDLQKGLSTSDTLASICNTPLAPNAPVFDLSALASEHNSRFNNSIVDYFCENKISTPCKFKEIKLVSVEIPAPKSPETSEVLGDLSGLQKRTQLGWEISEIPLPPDNTLSPDASIEEWQSSSAVVVDCDAALPQERSSFASAMSFQWTGAKPRTSSTLAFKSFSYESQSKEFESMASLTSSQSIKPFDFAIPSADERCNTIRLKAKKKY